MRFIFGLLFGLILGASLGLILAPHSAGRERRSSSDRAPSIEPLEDL